MNKYGQCELCGLSSPCMICSSKREPNSMNGRSVVHVVSGTPSQVTSEWSRLAKEDNQPS